MPYKKNILIVNSDDSHCGVYQYGLSLFEILKNYGQFNYFHVNAHDLFSFLNQNSKIDGIVYNWHPYTMPFLNQNIIDYFNSIRTKQILIVGHDHSAQFNNINYLSCDSTQLNGIPRPLIDVKNSNSSEELSVGSFGFAFDFKNFDKIPKLVSEQLPNAKLRMHVTPHQSGDSNGRIASLIKDLCHELNLEIEIYQNFIASKELVKFLSRNSINVFLYPESKGRGLSSSIDFAISANKPIALSDSDMFRHVSHEPKFFLKNYSLKQILEFGIDHIQPFRKAWSSDEVVRIIENELTK